jgi:hypothetical protein
MSYGWTTNHDGEPAGIHTLSCLIWRSPDPVDVCTCGADTTVVPQRRLSTAELLDRIDPTGAPS